MIDKRLDPLKNLGHKPFTDIGHSLPRIPGFDLFEIALCRRCEADNNPMGRVDLLQKKQPGEYRAV